MLKVVIFDLDGVIADSHPIHLIAWKALLQEQGRDLNDSELRFILAGRQRAEILRHYLGELPDSEIRRLGKRKDDLYYLNIDELRPMVGVLSVLEELEHSGVMKAVATSAGPERTWDTLRRFDIADRFSVVLTGSDAKAKPAPDVFTLAATKLDVKPADCLVIEDSVAGVQAAKAAGMLCIGYATQHLQAELKQAGADNLISAFTPGVVADFQSIFDNVGSSVSAQQTDELR